MASITKWTKIESQGRIVVPKDMLRALGVKERDPIVLECDDEGLHVRSVRQAIKHLQQMVAKFVKGRSLSAELIAERRREAERE